MILPFGTKKKSKRAWELVVDVDWTGNTLAHFPRKIGNLFSPMFHDIEEV